MKGLFLGLLALLFFCVCLVNVQWFFLNKNEDESKDRATEELTKQVAELNDHQNTLNIYINQLQEKITSLEHQEVNRFELIKQLNDKIDELQQQNQKILANK